VTDTLYKIHEKRTVTESSVRKEAGMGIDPRFYNKLERKNMLSFPFNMD